MRNETKNLNGNGTGEKTMTTKLKKEDFGKYQIISNGVVIGHVEEEVFGWEPVDLFPL